MGTYLSITFCLASSERELLTCSCGSTFRSVYTVNLHFFKLCEYFII
nr:MAG TPA: hypothetical protein [Caudoviricetes sp.]